MKYALRLSIALLTVSLTTFVSGTPAEETTFKGGTLTDDSNWSNGVPREGKQGTLAADASWSGGHLKGWHVVHTGGTLRKTSNNDVLSAGNWTIDGGTLGLDYKIWRFADGQKLNLRDGVIRAGTVVFGSTGSPDSGRAELTGGTVYAMNTPKAIRIRNGYTVRIGDQARIVARKWEQTTGDQNHAETPGKVTFSHDWSGSIVLVNPSGFHNAVNAGHVRVGGEEATHAAFTFKKADDGWTEIRLSAGEHGAATGGTPDEDEPRQRQRPNILFLAVDDMNDMVGAYGKQAKTPHIDRLAGRGMTFTNAHAAGTVCVPSRTALLTGKHPANTGWYTSQVYFYENPDLVSLPEAFNNAGYKVHGGGKVFHHGPGFVDLEAFDHFWVWHDKMKKNGWIVGSWKDPAPKPEGKKNFREMPGYPGTFWKMPDELEPEMADTITSRWAADFVGKDHDQPFFMAAGIFAPHGPHWVPETYYNRYSLDEITIPAGVRKGDLDDLPPHVRKGRRNRAKGHHQKIVENGNWKRAIRGYLAAMSYADAQVGRILKALREGPNADNTIVVFWSDHGYHLGEKQKWAKHTLWERTTNAPLIWAGPGIPEGETYDGVVSLLDIYPTLISMVGIEPPHDLYGRSMEEIFRAPHRLHERYASTAKGPQEWTVVGNNWRYIQRGSIGGELYNLRKDPHEWNNLANQNRYSGLIEHLKAKYPDNPAEPGPRPWKDLNLVRDGEDFYWKRKEEN